MVVSILLGRCPRVSRSKKYQSITQPMAGANRIRRGEKKRIIVLYYARSVSVLSPPITYYFVLNFTFTAVKEYQTFIVTLTRSLLTFGSPSHRIESQLLSLVKVFNVDAEFLHTAGTVQIAFGDAVHHNTENFLIKCNLSLSLSRIHNVHNIYRMVLHDEMRASDGTRDLKKLLEAPPRYGYALRCLLSFITSGLISGIAFGGSVNDMWVSGILGLSVRLGLNHASKSDLSASGSE